MTDATLFTLPDKPYWTYEKCAVCGKGFTEKSWDESHDFLHDTELRVHARCCRCQGRYDHEEQAEHD